MKNGAAPHRIINRSVHEALIKLIPIQAQKIREKAVARLNPPKSPSPSPPKEKQCAKPKKTKAATTLRWKEDKHEKTQQDKKTIEELDDILQRNCESRALACQEKLMELLGHCSPQMPNASRIACCLEILKEVCLDCMPFSRILSDILREFELALFWEAGDKNNTKPQVPYFELVSTLEEDIKKKEEDLRSWRNSLSEYQSHIQSIEETMESLGTQVKNADFLNKNLTASLAAANDSLESANDQLIKSNQKLLDLKQELRDAKAEVRRSKSLEGRVQHERDMVQQEQLKAEYAQLANELQHFQHFLDTARTQISASVPKADYLSMKAQMLELQRRLMEIQAKSVPGTDPTLSTLEQVAQICRQNAVLSNKLARLQSEWTSTNVALAEANEKFETANKKKK